MLYLLLGIIAVGVLLASEDGKKLLGFIFKLAIIGGVLFLVFWGVMLAMALVQEWGVTWEDVWALLIFIFVLVVGVWVVGVLAAWWSKFVERHPKLKKFLNSKWLAISLLAGFFLFGLGIPILLALFLS